MTAFYCTPKIIQVRKTPVCPWHSQITKISDGGFLNEESPRIGSASNSPGLRSEQAGWNTSEAKPPEMPVKKHKRASVSKKTDVEHSCCSVCAQTLEGCLDWFFSDQKDSAGLSNLDDLLIFFFDLQIKHLLKVNLSTIEPGKLFQPLCFSWSESISEDKHGPNSISVSCSVGGTWTDVQLCHREEKASSVDPDAKCTNVFLQDGEWFPPAVVSRREITIITNNKMQMLDWDEDCWCNGALILFSDGK